MILYGSFFLSAFFHAFFARKRASACLPREFIYVLYVSVGFRWRRQSKIKTQQCAHTTIYNIIYLSTFTISLTVAVAGCHLICNKNILFLLLWLSWLFSISLFFSFYFVLFGLLLRAFVYFLYAKFTKPRWHGFM